MGVWTTSRKPKLEARRLEILESLEEDTGMQGRIVQPEGSPTPNPRKTERLLDPADSLLDLTGHNSVPPPRMEPLAPLTLVMTALPITDKEAIGSHETKIPWSSTDQKDLEMGAPKEPYKNLKDSAHAQEVLEERNNKQGNEQDEDMEEEEV